MRAHLALVPVVFTAALTGQSRWLLDPADPGREIRVHHVARLLPAGDRAQALEELVTTLRRPVVPQLGEGEDLLALGDDKIVVLARPPQHVWVDRALATWGQPPAYHVGFELLVLVCPPSVHARYLEPRLTAAGLDPARGSTSWLELEPPRLVVPAAENPRALAAELRAADGVTELGSMTAKVAPMTTTQLLDGS